MILEMNKKEGKMKNIIWIVNSNSTRKGRACLLSEDYDKLDKKD